MKVIVKTLLTQELEVPDGIDHYEVYDFLAEHQSFRSAFQGVSNQDNTFRIVDIGVIDEYVEQMGEEILDA